MLELDQIQALVLRERPAPYFGSHIFLEVSDARGGREFLRDLATQIANAIDWDKPRIAWTAVSFTYPGLVALGVPEESLATFPSAFREGMPARADRLRDHGPNDPSNWDAPFGTKRIHMLVTVVGAVREGWLQAMEAFDLADTENEGVEAIARDDFGASPDLRNAFGYRDGISQPAIEGSGVPTKRGSGRAIREGEFVLGYPCETGAHLPAPQPNELGRNGTYLVFRKYASHVAAFNRFLHANGKTEAERELLAAKLVGRWRSGAPLMLSPDRDSQELGSDPERCNDFDYKSDPTGRVVPLGAHMRRMNPRGSKLAVMADLNVRRITRRSTSYGEPLATDALEDDGKPRGIHFIALGSRAIENVEFLQSEWIDSGNFAGLGPKEKDPLTGLHGDDCHFTLPGAPPRRIRGIECFNTLLGGDYFFVPSLSALRWICDLPD